LGSEAGNTEIPAKLNEHAMRLSGLIRYVPPSLRDALKRLHAANGEERLIVDTDLPLRAYVHPRVSPGSALLSTGHCEPETEKFMRSCLRQGQTFLDIGANEGILSAYAGTLVGPGGTVVAVELQSRLQDFIEINMALNRVANYFIYRRALGGKDGEVMTLNLYPLSNHGQSSLVKKPAFGWTAWRRQNEQITFVSLATIMKETKVSSFDLVKVDVEGFEPEVVGPGWATGLPLRVMITVSPRSAARNRRGRWVLAS
jgi:FkbM family methyltransferase